MRGDLVFGEAVASGPWQGLPHGNVHWLCHRLRHSRTCDGCTCGRIVRVFLSSSLLVVADQGGEGADADQAGADEEEGHGAHRGVLCARRKVVEVVLLG